MRKIQIVEDGEVVEESPAEEYILFTMNDGNDVWCNISCGDGLIQHVYFRLLNTILNEFNKEELKNETITSERETVKEE